MNSFVSPFFADAVLIVVYLAMVAALGVTAFSVVYELRNRQKGDGTVNGVPAGRIGWCVVAGLIASLVLTFVLGSSAPVMTNGVSFTDSFWLRVADMFIYTSIILIAGCFVGAIVSRFRS